MAALDIFILVVYIILLQPILYCLWKHGKSGMLGWLPLQSFALVRIIGSILAIHNAAVHSTSEDALIFSNVGLSPLLLATAGILHEARKARNPSLNLRWEWFRLINYHALIIGSMLLVIFGVIKEMDDAPHTPTALMKAGVACLLLCWILLATYVLLTWFRAVEHATHNPIYNDGTTLLFGVLCGLPFILLREVYALLTVFIKNPEFKNNTAAQVIMSVVSELFCTLILIFVGIWTRNIGKVRNTNKA